MFEGKNGKKATNKEKSALSPRQCTVSSRSQWWQNYMNFTSNCFHTHPPYSSDLAPATTVCLQTSKECSRERFGSNEEVISETEVYFEARHFFFFFFFFFFFLKNCFFFFHQIVREALEIVYHPRKLLINKVEFCLKVILLVKPGIY